MAPVTGVARELCRSATFTPAAQGEHSDGRTLVGYAATFGDPTEIHSWEGNFTETIRAGAFKKSLRERTPVMQFDHGHHPLIGSIPIGSISDVREDEHGLFVEGRISDNWLMQPIRDAIAEGSVKGMSFRFEVVREEWRDASGKVLKDPEEIYNRLYMPDPEGPLQRELIELKVRELGPVVFPAYESTTVGVRARSVADELTSNSNLADQVRLSLVTDNEDVRDLEDPDFRREVALAILLERMGAPDEIHPPTVEETPNDAPPVEGHPSAETVRMREQIRDIRSMMDDILSPLNDKEK